VGNRGNQERRSIRKTGVKSAERGAKSKEFNFLLKKLDIHVKFGQPLGERQEYFHFLDRRGRWSRM
jgi:hypothetical protein